jgi:hypothetical protein
MTEWLGPIDAVVEHTGVPEDEILKGMHGVCVDCGQVFRSSRGIARHLLEDPNWVKLATMKPIKKRRR